jgi:hypothetical protein
MLPSKPPLPPLVPGWLEAGGGVAAEVAVGCAAGAAVPDSRPGAGAG